MSLDCPYLIAFRSGEEAKKEGWAKATKLQDRSMSQGLIGLISDNSAVTMIEVYRVLN
jgi:translation elongation factor EF-Ts